MKTEIELLKSDYRTLEMNRDAWRDRCLKAEAKLNEQRKRPLWARLLDAVLPVAPVLVLWLIPWWTIWIHHFIDAGAIA